MRRFVRMVGLEEVLPFENKIRETREGSKERFSREVRISLDVNLKVASARNLRNEEAQFPCLL